MTSMKAIDRVSAGVPQGGEFANRNRAEADVTLGGFEPEIIQVNSNWQISGAFGLGGGDRGTFFVGKDLAGEGYTEKMDFYRFPIGWRSGQLDRSTVPAAVKTAIRKAMKSWP